MKEKLTAIAETLVKQGCSSSEREEIKAYFGLDDTTTDALIECIRRIEKGDRT